MYEAIGTHVILYYVNPSLFRSAPSTKQLSVNVMLVPKVCLQSHLNLPTQSTEAKHGIEPRVTRNTSLISDLCDI